jgi:hypothetical protein
MTIITLSFLYIKISNIIVKLKNYHFEILKEKKNTEIFPLKKKKMMRYI